MKALRNAMAAALAVCLGNAAVGAGNVQLATVTHVDARADGTFLVSFSKASTMPPSCATELTRMSGTTSTPGGKAVLAAAMVAFAAGSQVNAQGTGSCGEFETVESILILVQGR
jgi:hypothetical protein